MALWGKAHASADNKPKYLPDNTNSDYDMHDAYATNSGWVMKAGSKATGNGNTSAAPEILVAIRGLAGATATTGLRLPTMTKFRYRLLVKGVPTKSLFAMARIRRRAKNNNMT